MTEETPGGEAACFLHHLVDGRPVDPDTARDVARFRRAERQRLYALRQAMTVDQRRAAGQSITAVLNGVTGAVKGRSVAAYWPIRGEPDLRGWMREIHARGAEVLLPVVVQKDQPLVFRVWHPGCPMERGLWNIPVPSDGAERIPEIVVSPLVGFDPAGFRLGNGGGYYDRTLVRIDPRPRIIAVGFAASAIATIFPMPWDVAMDVVVLDDGTVRHREG